MEFVQPDLLLVDHAPTALLASRGLGVRRAAIVTVFFLPPTLAPILALREWESVDPARVRQSEHRAVAIANLVLATPGEAPVALLPMHAEQLLFSRRVADTGAGILVTETEARQKLAKQVLLLVREAGCRDSARAVADKHAADAERDVAVDVATRCIELAGG